jgi:hypothetical protein
MNTRSKLGQKPPPVAESSEYNDESDAESSESDDESSILGNGSSDDDEEDSESLSSGDEDVVESFDENDEDDIIVAQWRRNSYSDSTLVLFFNLQCVAAI